MKLAKACLLAGCIFIGLSSYGQFDSLVKNIRLADTFNSAHAREKIFVHYDRPYYNLNDTLWLKGYTVWANNNAAADSSSIAYIEIIDAAGNLVKRRSTYCMYGMFASCFPLPEADFAQGAYVLRAYTRHMRNYGDSLFFESKFSIVNPADNQWQLLVDTVSFINSRLLINAAPMPATQQKFRQQNVAVAVRSQRRVLFIKNMVTDTAGRFFVDTLLSGKSLNKGIKLEITPNGGTTIVLPIAADKPQQTDLQFLPEGGSFIANKWQQLGFKAINNFGKGVFVKGNIEDSKKQVVASFTAVHNGMGTVWMRPLPGESYTAVLDNGLAFPLPAPMPHGTQLQVACNAAADSVVVRIDASPDLYNNAFFLRASVAGNSIAMGPVRLKDSAYSLSISKKAFPQGVCRFTLYNASAQPVNERAILVWHRDTLGLQLKLNKDFYSQRDSVHVLLTAKNGRTPAIGSFSAAVIDTSFVKYPTHSPNIISHLLLTSDLVGPVENPAYYFDAPLPEATEALMLTQGWVQYNQFYKSAQPFAYDSAFAIIGKVTNLFNKPAVNTSLTLFGKDGSTSPFIVTGQSDNNGQFVFKDFPTFRSDSVSLLIRAVTKKGKSFGIGVEVDLPDFPSYDVERETTDDAPVQYNTKLRDYVQQQVKITNELKTQKGYLENVIVRGKIRVKGSRNLNEDGGSDQTIGAKVLEAMPKSTLLEVLTKELPGLHVGTLPKSDVRLYKRNGDMIVFIIDGYNILQFFQATTPSNNELLNYEETYLKYIAAEDVAGIEVMHSSKNSNAYQQHFGLYSSALVSYTFVEITTFSGNGAFMKKMANNYLYKPLAPVVAKSFYAPRYSAPGNETTLPDFRKTIYWSPDIITNEKGEAGFSFYTSDNSGGLVLVLQGTDLQGSLGVVYLPIKVSKVASNGE